MKKVIIFTFFCGVIATTKAKDVGALPQPPVSPPPPPQPVLPFLGGNCIAGNCKQMDQSFGIVCYENSGNGTTYGIHCLGSTPGYYCLQTATTIKCSCNIYSKFCVP